MDGRDAAIDCQKAVWREKCQKWPEKTTLLVLRVKNNSYDWCNSNCVEHPEIGIYAPIILIKLFFKKFSKIRAFYWTLVITNLVYKQLR